MYSLDMSFAAAFSVRNPDAYERLILDVGAGQPDPVHAARRGRGRLGLGRPHHRGLAARPTKHRNPIRPEHGVLRRRHSPHQSATAAAGPRARISERGQGYAPASRAKSAMIDTYREPRHLSSRAARWGCSSDGRALQSHCRGQRFDSAQLHHVVPKPRSSCLRSRTVRQIEGLHAVRVTPADRRTSRSGTSNADVETSPHRGDSASAKDPGSPPPCRACGSEPPPHPVTSDARSMLVPMLAGRRPSS